MIEKVELLENKMYGYIKKLDTLFLKTDKLIAVGAVFILCVALIPLYIYGRYAVPLADDYCMVLNTHAAWETTHSVWQVLKTAVKTMREYYMTWSGAFIGMFLQSLLPGLGDFRTYFIASWILITLFVGAHYYLGYVILCEILNAKKAHWIIFTTVVVLFQIEHMPYLHDAFFWYVGAMAYMFPYAMKLIYTGVLLHCIHVWNGDKKISAVKLILLAGYTVFIAGNDYGSTCTPMVVLLFVIVAYSVIQNKGKAYILTSAAIYMVTWFVCILAPGNRARQALVSDRNGFFYTIKEALYAGAHYITVWTGSRMVFMSLILLPIIIYMVKRADFKFKYPAICVLMTYGGFSALFAPRIYASYSSGKESAGYTLNFIHCLFVMIWIINLVYITGWIVKSFFHGEEEKKFQFSPVVYYFALFAAMFILFKADVYMAGDYTSTQVYYQLKSGNPQRYMAAMLEREALMEMSEGFDLLVEDIPMPFVTSGGGDITETYDTWTNLAVSQYYRLNSIVKNVGEQ